MKLASRFHLVGGLCLATALGGMAALVGRTALAAAAPSGDLLGIRLGMSDDEARTRLRKLGEPATSEESPKQTWNLRDRRYGSLTIRYDSEWRVQWMTVFARDKGTRVRYRDIGDLGKARRTGTYVYTWTLPLSRTGVPSAVTARGEDSSYLASVSIHPPAPPPAAPAAPSGSH